MRANITGRIGCLVVAALAAGCGGGGGGNTRTDPPSVPPALPADPPSIPPALPSAAWVDRLKSQPVLSQVSARQALQNRGLSGAGVRVAVEDDSVDFLTPQLVGRVETDPAKGAEFTYLHPLALVVNPAPPCDGVQCTVLEVASSDDVEARARDSILVDGYPTDTAPRYIKVVDPDVPASLRWYRIPGVGSAGKRTHGTAVASVIVGADTGVAPGARVVPWTIPLDEDPDVQAAQSRNTGSIVDLLARLGPTHPDVVSFDRAIASARRDRNAHVDIVNRSYGIPVFSDTDRDFDDRATTRAWDWLRMNLPNYWGSLLQIGVPEARKTLFVTAAGNIPAGLPNPPQSPGASASMAWWNIELRGLHFAAVGVRPDGSLHPSSVPCGSLPADWVASTHGRHYCLAAPFTVNVAKTGRNPSPAHGSASGTSFSAPMVAGAMALVMEQSRGTMTPREVGRRVVDTADNTVAGYDPTRIGAGVLDIEAATRPVGSMRTGLPGHEASPRRSWLSVSRAYGDSVALAVEGFELASFDSANFPFWTPLSDSVSSAPRSSVPLIPPARSVPTAVDPLLPASLRWASVGSPNLLPGHQVRLVTPTARDSVLAGFTRASGVELVPRARGFGFGLLYEADGVQGGRSAGAFGAGARSATVWLKRRDGWKVPLPNGEWRLRTEVVFGAGRGEVSSGAMFEPGPGMYSSATVSLLRSAASGFTTELSVSQPWRAESGSARLTFPATRTLDGDWVYRSLEFGLAPEGREIAFGLRHDRPLFAGEASVSVGYSHDAGHVRGAEDVRGGVAWRLSW